MVSVGIGGFLWRYMAHKERRADERFDRMETKFDERCDRMETKTEERINRMETKTEERIDRLEAKTEERFDRMEDRIEGLTREVVANGRAIARIEGRHEGHPLAVAE